VSIASNQAQAIVRETLISDDLFGALRVLNQTTEYRFTGIYLLDGRWVKSVLLFDRDCPNVQIGHDVLWDESYCRLAATDGIQCEITNSLTDPRLTKHAAREAVQCYCGVLLRSPDGQPLGTLCHFDVRPRDTPTGALNTLKALRPMVENLLWAQVSGVTQSSGGSVQRADAVAPGSA